MKKILLGLFLVFSFFSFFGFSPIASATGFEDVDWTVPMTSTAQARLRIGVANFSKVWAYKATMTNGEVTGLSLVCQYASSSNGVNPIVKECLTFINNDDTNLVLVAFSNNANAGVIADLLPGSGGVFALSDDVQYPRIISASVLASGAIPTTAQLIPEINYGFPSLPQDPIAQNGDPGWNYLPLSSDSAWIGAGLPVPAEPGHYIVKLVKNAGAGGSSGVPTLDFKANGQTTVTLTSAPSATNPVNLTWTATGVSSCTASTTANPTAPAVWTGTKTTSGTFALTNLAPSTSYQLKLDCSDSGGNHVIKSVTVNTAPPASTVTLTSSDPDNSVLSTETFTLSWTSTGTPAGDSCSRSATPAVTAWTAATAADAGGPITIGPLAVGSYVFKVECNNPSGVLPTKASTTLTINVTAPVASVIFTNPSVTVPAPGGNATLTWTPTNAGSCVISPTSTPAGPTGTTTGNSWTGTFPTAGTFTYKVTCTATGGALPVNPEATATVTVTALLPVPSLSFTPPIPTSVQAGGTVTLAWTSSGMAANSCNRTGGFGTWATTGGATTGSATMTAPNTTGDYTFTVTCTTTGGQSTFITSVITVTGGSSPSVASVSFIDNSLEIQASNTATLSWTPINANNCNITSVSGPTGTTTGNNWIGMFPTAGTFTYKVTCTATGGALPVNPEATATVTVTTTPPPAVSSVVFANSSLNVQTNNSATLTWTPTNAGSCVISPTSTPAGPTGTTTGNSWTGTFPTAGTFTYKVTCTATGGALPVNPEATATIHVTAGAGGATASVTIKANGSTAPISILPNEPLNISWEATDVVSYAPCKTTGGSTNWATPQLPAIGNWTVIPALSVAGESYTYNIECTPASGAGTANVSASVTVSVSNTAPLSASVVFVNSPLTVQTNAPAVLNFLPTNANNCIVTTVGTPAGPYGATNQAGNLWLGSFPVAGTFTYKVTCTATGGALPVHPEAFATVTVTETLIPPTVTLNAKPLTVPTGTTSNLTWTSSGLITSCTKTGPKSWKLTTENNGSKPTGTLTTPGTATYGFQCTGPGGTSNLAQVTVTWYSPVLPAPPAVTISAAPLSVATGAASTLTWTSSGLITSCTKTGPKNWKLVPGNNSTPAGWITGTLDAPGTATYGFQCTGPGGTSNLAQVTVTWYSPVLPAPPAVTLNAKPLTVPTGTTSNLTWTSSGLITSCTKTGPKSWKLTTENNGSKPTGTLTTPGTATYGFQCTGPGGTSNLAQVTVTWYSPVLPAPPAVTISAAPNPVSYGSNTTVTWSSSGANSCTKTNGAGTWTTGTETSGAFTIGAPYTFTAKTYNISCTGPGGTTAKSVTVTVN